MKPVAPIRSAVPWFRLQAVSVSLGRPAVGLMWVGAVVLLLGGGCDDGPPVSAPNGATSARQPYIAFVGAGGDDALWPIIQASAMKAGEVLGRMRLVTDAPSVATQEAQNEIIEGLRQPGLRALCVQVVDPAASARLLADIRTSGVLVVTLVQPVPASPPFNHCGLDEVAVGHGLADGIAQVMGGEGTVAVLRAPPTDTRYADRYRGFRAALHEQRGLRVLRELTCDGDPRKARETIQAFCERFPSVGGIVCLDDWPLRTPDALSHPLVPEGCQLVTVNPTPDRWPLLARGWCAALVGGDYAAMANRALRWCLVVSKDGELSTTDQSVSIRVVTHRNLKAWVDDWERWLAYGRSRPRQSP